MEWLTNIPDWLSLIFGGSIISIVTWRFARQKAAAEAKEAEAMKEKQDYYQQMADDLARDRDYYKGERDEYRKTIKAYDERMDVLERNQARQGRMIEAMRPFLCADLSCKLRKRVVASDIVAGSADTDAAKKPQEIEPNNEL